MLNRKQVMQQLARPKNKKIKLILENENKKDADGFSIKCGKLNKIVYANVRSLRGKEFYSAAQVKAQDDKIFYINYFPGLTAKVQIEYKKELYNIVAPPVNINEANIEYEIHAKLVKPSG